MTITVSFLLAPALLLISCMLAPFLLILSFTCLFVLLFIYAFLLKRRPKTATYAVQQWSREHTNHQSNHSTSLSMSLLDQLRSHWTYQLIARSKTVVLTGLQIASGLGALWRAGGLSGIRVRRASVAINPRHITSTTITNNSNNNNNNVYEHSSHRVNSHISTNLIEYHRKSSNSKGSSSNTNTNNNNISETPSYTTSNANQANSSYHRLNNKLNSALSIRKYHSRHATVTGLGATSSSSSLVGVAFVRRPTTSMLNDIRILPTKIQPASSTRLKSGIEDVHHLPFMILSKMTAKRQYTTHLRVDSVK